MGDYVLDHHLHGEGARLALMSRLLDPMHRRYIEALGIGPGARTLEVGFGNGSGSSWLAELVGPTGQAVAVDIDLSLVDQNTAPANLDYLQADIVAGPVDPGTFDLVTARAVLHHVTDVDAAMRNLVASLAPGGAILLIEPDFLPVSIAEPAEVHRFWEGWLAWSREQGIDYFLGRTLNSRLAALDIQDIAGTAETAVYQGGSPWATYWVDTVDELPIRPGGVRRPYGRPRRSLPDASSPTPPGGRRPSRSPRPTAGRLAAESGDGLSPGPRDDDPWVGCFLGSSCQADRCALSLASRAALSGSIGRKVSIARFAAVTSSGAPRVAMSREQLDLSERGLQPERDHRLGGETRRRLAGRSASTSSMSLARAGSASSRLLRFSR